MCEKCWKSSFTIVNIKTAMFCIKRKNILIIILEQECIKDIPQQHFTEEVLKTIFEILKLHIKFCVWVNIMNSQRYFLMYSYLLNSNHKKNLWLLLISSALFIDLHINSQCPPLKSKKKKKKKNYSNASMRLSSQLLFTFLKEISNEYLSGVTLQIWNVLWLYHIQGWGLCTRKIIDNILEVNLISQHFFLHQDTFNSLPRFEGYASDIEYVIPKVQSTWKSLTIDFELQ